MVNLIRCKTKQDSVRKNLVRPVPAGYPGRSLEAVGNDSSREMVIAPQGVQNPAYSYPILKALANCGSLLLIKSIRRPSFYDLVVIAVFPLLFVIFAIIFVIVHLRMKRFQV